MEHSSTDLFLAAFEDNHDEDPPWTTLSPNFDAASFAAGHCRISAVSAASRPSSAFGIIPTPMYVGP